MPPKGGCQWRSSDAALTTTSYAILGLLAVRPWTTYELAQQMHRALGQFWPRAESKLYEEPKKLVAHGLARATQRDGRQAAPHRLLDHREGPAGDGGVGAAARRRPGARVRGAGEGVLRRARDKEDLLATLDRVRAWSDEQHRDSVGHLAGATSTARAPFPERLPWLVLCGQFLEEFDIMVERWAEWAASVVETWPDDITEPPSPSSTCSKRRQLRAEARRDRTSPSGRI